MRNFFESKNLAIVYLITFLVSACSIGYELLLAHRISLATGSTVTWYGIVVGVYLGSLGVGAFFVSFLEKKASLQKIFVQVEIILALVGATSVLIVSFAHMANAHLIIKGSAVLGGVLFLFFSIGSIFVIGFLSGVELPVLMKMANKISVKENISNRVLAVDYFGSLLGAVSFPLLLLPSFDVIMVGFIFAAVNIFAALFVFILVKKISLFQQLQFFCLIFFLFLGFLNAEKVDQYFAKKYYYYLSTSQDIRSLLEPLNEKPDVERFYSSYQTIDFALFDIEDAPSVLMDVYTNKNCSASSRADGMELYLNGDWQLNVTTERIYHEYFAHVPVYLSGRVPQKILVLGGGDGALVRELLKYDQIEEIVHVDLDPKMVDLAKTKDVLLEMNEGSFLNDKVETVIEDAFSFVKNSKETFDAVYLDLPTPVDYNVSKLYSKEFYFFVSKRILDDGYIAFDVPGVGSFFKYDKNKQLVFDKEGSPLTSYYSTVYEAGFEKVIPFSSLLEDDNPSAYFVSKSHLLEEEMKRRKKTNQSTKNREFLEKKISGQARDFVRDFVSNQQEGFIFAQKTTQQNVEKFPVNSNFCILSEERARLAVNSFFGEDLVYSPEKVNSIIKPVIPLSSYWRIKLPFHIQ